jgi:hypothetical protein
MSSTVITTPIQTSTTGTAGTTGTPVPAKVVPVGTFMNIAFYFGTFFLFVFFLFLILKVVVGGKSDK